MLSIPEMPVASERLISCLTSAETAEEGEKRQNAPINANSEEHIQQRSHLSRTSALLASSSEPYEVKNPYILGAKWFGHLSHT